MTYLVKEIFFTLQGEGFHVGTPAVFCRFSGCNLWTGREEHRAIAACPFCDTDFVGTNGTGGGHFQSPDQLGDAIAALWAPGPLGERFVVCTGGEPLLQLDGALVEALHDRGFRVAIETNGTLRPPPGVDWICVSPKAGVPLALDHADELKLVYPQAGADPAQFEGFGCHHFFLQPMDGANRDGNTAAAVAYCLEHPRWRLSLQTHKYLGIR